MGKALVVVESPSKAKTINKYLGPEYIVEASLGHVRDLPKKDIAVNVEEGFIPTYVTIDRKQDVLSRLRQLSKQCDAIYLATDPDREGEAIAWHVAQEIADDSLPLYRVLFNEITSSGVKKAMTTPRKIDMDLVRAQEARRVMDRLIGYKISPFLWNAFRGEAHTGLSAGRVQSVALRLVVEREKEINSFIPIEYWNLIGTFKTEKDEEFTARLVEYDGIQLRNPTGSASKEGGSQQEGERKAFISTEEEAKIIRDRALFQDYRVEKLEQKEVRRAAPPPFTTSTLQQDAGRRLKMKPKATMMAAQKLYEGVELGSKGRVGLITYMRTDSVRVSDEAVAAAHEWVFENYGKEYVPQKPKEHKQKKGAIVQDAHEAIRPADLKITPRAARKLLDEDLANLYELIYRRFIASQMTDALFDQTVVEIRGGTFLFRTSGRVNKFRGWMQVYDDQEERTEIKKASANDDGVNEEGRTLPASLRKDGQVELLTLITKRSETKPPPRYTESTLVKELEAKGVGRPSTYAQTIATIVDRGYVFESGRLLHASELGIRVSDALTTSFPKLFDVKFTARMEKDLDSIADGKQTYLKVMQGFYKPFTIALKGARIDAGSGSANSERRTPPRLRKTTAKELKGGQGKAIAGVSGSGEKVLCDQCGSGMELREGKYGPYYACTSFPKCSRLIPAADVEKKSETNVVKGMKSAGTRGSEKGKADGIICDACGSPMIRRSGKNGEFYGCSTFPACRHTKPVTMDVKCPTCGEGFLVERTGGKYNSTFYGCSRYPDCRYTARAKPEVG
ncbi:MAG: type I DNA topoisomerase [Candidatus Kapaibacterium sp.]